MKKFIMFFGLLILTNNVTGQVPWENGKLMVSENGWYIQHENGKPFFWLGDTAYSGFDITKPIITPGNDPNDEEQYDYWDHVDYAIDVATQNGIYLGILATWRDLHKQDKNLNKEKAELFAAHLANYFKDKPNII